VVVDRTGGGLFGIAMRHASVGMALVSPSGTFLDVNDALCRFLGRDAAELTSLTFQDVTHPDDLDADLVLLGRALGGEIDSYRISKRYLRVDGAVRHAELAVAAVRSDDGALRFFLSQVADVTDQVEAQRESEAAREQLRGVVDTLLDPWVLMTAVRDDGGRIVDFAYADANEAACAANGLTRQQLLSTTLLTLLPGHATNGLLEAYADVVSSGRPLSLDDHPYPAELGDGSMRWYDNRAVKVGDGLSFTWRDVTDRVQARQQLQVQADSDPLTGLANRHKLLDALTAAFSRTPRTGTRLALLFCDLDRLKAINDRYGHAAGDLVIRAVAERLAASVRHADLAARIGGDEFVVLLDGVHDEADAVAVAEKIAQAVSRPVRLDEGEIVPTLSIGLAVGDPGDDPEAVLERADAALFRDKLGRRTQASPVDAD